MKIMVVGIYGTHNKERAINSIKIAGGCNNTTAVKIINDAMHGVETCICDIKDGNFAQLYTTLGILALGHIVSTIIE